MGSFFGVTSLGPESIFQSNQLSTLGAALFTDDEFKKAFDSITGPDRILATSQLTALLCKTFGFQPLPEEIELFESNLPRDSFCFEDLSRALKSVRSSLAELKKGATEYRSWVEMNDDRRKGCRKKVSPADIFKSPLTTQQAVGWDTAAVFAIPRFPKRTCPETRFAAAFHQSGWQA